MDFEACIKFCKDLHCCDACCLRYIGLKNPNAYENPDKFVAKYQDLPLTSTDTITQQDVTKDTKDHQNGTDTGLKNEADSPPAKRHKPELNICHSCLGILQEDYWAASCAMVKEVLDKKRYSCSTFACALSAPMATLLREKTISLLLAKQFAGYSFNVVTPLKEAWKWSFGNHLAAQVGKTLDSGAVSPLLVTLNMEYPDDLQELEVLKTVSPSVFEDRNKQKRRFAVEFTRRSVEEALDAADAGALQGTGLVIPTAPAKCISVVCTHTPVYLAGRYVKLSRELPQTPWLVGGVRMMESSVQETIFEPIARLCGLEPGEEEHRLKLMSAGREDVDVRCLGVGRPFAIEITDPRRELTQLELQEACKQIASTGKVIVNKLTHISKEDLIQLKKGEETKCKTYEALCIKLAHSKHDDMANGETPVSVTEEDINRINTYRNTEAGDPARIALHQRTPIRVLHRRPLLTRIRKILDLSATLVEGHPQLFKIRVRTEAGTYIKEWVHGEVGRTQPSLGDALGAPVDILALDVASVELEWPPNK